MDALCFKSWPLQGTIELRLALQTLQPELDVGNDVEAREREATVSYQWATRVLAYSIYIYR